MSNFFTRTVTGVFIVVFIYGGFWLHPVSFLLTGLVLLSGCLAEYYRLIKTAGIKPQVLTGMTAGITLYVVSALVAAGLFAPVMFLLVPVLLIIIQILELFRRQDRPFDSLAHTLLPLLYIALPLSLLPFSAFGRQGTGTILGHGDYVFSPGIILSFLALLWINDTGAYLAGVSFGKHRLLERISPKKTWEGFAGGLVLTMAASLIMPALFGITGRTGWVIIATIISIGGTFGDLVESMLKRGLNVKDSGNILPGHGGFLDRFDSVLISFPLVFIYLSFFG